MFGTFDALFDGCYTSELAVMPHMRELRSRNGLNVIRLGKYYVLYFLVVLATVLTPAAVS